MLSNIQRTAEGTASKHAAMLMLRVSTAGLMFWWGLVKGLNTGVGQAVSDKYYGGAFTADTLLIAFGWLQVAAAIALALGLLRHILLPFQLVVNVFVAVAVWTAFVDPFWMWMAGEKPSDGHALFYPSLIIAAASWVLWAFRDQDAWALDRTLAPRSVAA